MEGRNCCCICRIYWLPQHIHSHKSANHRQVQSSAGDIRLEQNMTFEDNSIGTILTTHSIRIECRCAEMRQDKELGRRDLRKQKRKIGRPTQTHS
ncbi:hypothetical protein WR25_10636 [Diploscapter pachys]|uniref:Uncharacterized protein n=1 Tax=Diploscapter pachys TaxID=2018661 RepID=A0A2A2KZY2_9BILA|nr:hypothetical protein WR25_10636 [Diploscapter pachys]